MKPNKQSRSDTTRAAILKVAESVFAEVGYAAARLEDVALAVSKLCGSGEVSRGGGNHLCVALRA